MSVRCEGGSQRTPAECLAYRSGTPPACDWFKPTYQYGWCVKLNLPDLGEKQSCPVFMYLWVWSWFDMSLLQNNNNNDLTICPEWDPCWSALRYTSMWRFTLTDWPFLIAQGKSRKADEISPWAAIRPEKELRLSAPNGPNIWFIALVRSKIIHLEDLCCLCLLWLSWRGAEDCWDAASGTTKEGNFPRKSLRGGWGGGLAETEEREG